MNTLERVLSGGLAEAAQQSPDPGPVEQRLLDLSPEGTDDRWRHRRLVPALVAAVALLVIGAIFAIARVSGDRDEAPPATPPEQTVDRSLLLDPNGDYPSISELQSVSNGSVSTWVPGDWRGDCPQTYLQSGVTAYVTPPTTAAASCDPTGAPPDQVLIVTDEERRPDLPTSFETEKRWTHGLGDERPEPVLRPYWNVAYSGERRHVTVGGQEATYDYREGTVSYDCDPGCSTAPRLVLTLHFEHPGAYVSILTEDTDIMSTLLEGFTATYGQRGHLPGN